MDDTMNDAINDKDEAAAEQTTNMIDMERKDESSSDLNMGDVTNGAGDEQVMEGTTKDWVCRR